MKSSRDKAIKNLFFHALLSAFSGCQAEAFFPQLSHLTYLRVDHTAPFIPTIPLPPQSCTGTLAAATANSTHNGPYSTTGDDKEWTLPSAHSYDDHCFLYPCYTKNRCIYAPANDEDLHCEQCRCSDCLIQLDAYVNGNSMSPLPLEKLHDLPKDDLIVCTLSDDLVTGHQQSSVHTSNEFSNRIETTTSTTESSGPIQQNWVPARERKVVKSTHGGRPHCLRSDKMASIQTADQQSSTKSSSYSGCKHSATTSHYRLTQFYFPYKANYFRCHMPGCEYASTTSSDLTRHLLTHTDRRLVCYQYSDCQHSSTDRNSLNTHLRIHRAEKLFHCDHPGCKYSTFVESVLNKHTYIHTKEKPFPCDHPNCKFSFISKSSLKAHSYTHSGKKPFKCDHPDCNYTTAIQSCLNVHKYSHMKKKPFQCEHPNCQYTTISNSRLRVHLRTHTGERPFQCDHPGCLYSATTRSRLNKHKRIHDKPKTPRGGYPN